jgi:hypothetical protein
MRRIVLWLVAASALLSCSSPTSGTIITADGAVTDGSAALDGGVTPTDNGGVTPTDNGGSTGAVTVDSFPADYVRAVCASLVSCPARSSDAVYTLQVGTPATCVERVLPGYQPSLEDLLGSMRAGRVRLDGAAMRRCLDRIGTACLPVNSSLVDLCPDVLVGTIAAGSGCWTNVECAAGLYCEHGVTPRSCPGTCQALRAVGAACTDTSQCPRSPGHVPFCIETCVDGTIGPDAAEGAPCGRVRTGASALSVVACSRGLFCALDGTGLGACRRVRAEGDPCTPADACAIGLACRASAGTTTTTCRRVTIVDAPGGACDVEGAVGLCNEALNLTCTGGACRRGGDGSADSPCANARPTSCQPGLYCAPNLTCQPRLAPGAPCQLDIDCRSYSCSQEMPRRCLERVCY